MLCLDVHRGKGPQNDLVLEDQRPELAVVLEDAHDLGKLMVALACRRQGLKDSCLLLGRQLPQGAACAHQLLFFAVLFIVVFFVGLLIFLQEVACLRDCDLRSAWVGTSSAVTS